MRMRRSVKAALPASVKLKVWQAVVRLNPTSGVFECADGRLFEHTSDGVFARVLLEGDYEPELSQIARSVLRPGDIAVDAGANFGWYTTLFARAVGTNGKVFSVEPVSETFERLKRNVELNEMSEVVAIHNCAVGADSGSVKMSNTEESAFAFATHSSSSADVVPLERLDDIVREHYSSVALVKIDVEGFEEEVLRGATMLVGAEHPPVLQIEINDEALQRAGSSRNSIMQLLAQLGYSAFHVSRHLELEPAVDDATDIFA